MPAPRLDDEIARLYQLPLADFTAARNMLAKSAGARAAEIRSLAKPPVPAWAVNQLFWQDRATYDRLLEAAADVRAAHAAVLAGKRSDVRASGRAHEEAIEAALKSALAIVREAGHPATDATRHAISTTLRALPGDEPPGRLTHTLQPGGFEVLAGLPVRSAPDRGGRAARGKAAGPPASASTTKPSKTREAAPEPRERERERARAREARAEAERDVRLAEHTAKREEFEAARAAREADKAARAVTEARAAVEEAEAALAEAEQAARAAREAKEAADARTEEADAALQAARDRLRALPREK